MKTTRLTKVLSFLLCMVLLAATALCTSGCNDNNTPTSQTSALPAETVAVGQGATRFSLTVTDDTGRVTAYSVQTDKTTVGEALLELDLIAGEQGAYGLYVKTVAGRTVDYNKDGKYWAFYVNGQYAVKGVDLTEIDPAAAYALKVE